MKERQSFKKQKISFICYLYLLCLFTPIFVVLYFYIFQGTPLEDTYIGVTPSSEPTQVIKKPIYIISESKEINSSWKTYTFNPKMDINQDIYKTYPNFNIPPFTFKYPPRLKLKKTGSTITDFYDPIYGTKLLKGTKSVSLVYEISLDDSEVGCEYLLDGGCPGINIAFSFYTSAEDVSYYRKIQDARINAIPATLAYSYDTSLSYPITTLFTLSPSVVMKVEVIEMCNTDLCRTETKKINAILSTIKNSDIPDINYVKRDFSADDYFFEKEKYPESLTSIDDYKLLQFYCSKEFISNGDSGIYVHYDAKTQKEFPLTDEKLQLYLKKISEKYNSPNSTVKHFFPSIRNCDVEDGRSLFFYTLGPCRGSGCGGIQHIASMSETGEILFDNVITPNVEGVPYYGCKLLALVKPSFISQQYGDYLLCEGEGYTSIENADLNTNVYEMVKRCQYDKMEANAHYRCWEK